MDWSWFVYTWAWLMLWSAIQTPLVVNPLRKKIGKKPLPVNSWASLPFDLAYATACGTIAGLIL